MNDFVKNEWGLTAVNSCEWQVIEGGYVEPSISDMNIPQNQETIIERLQKIFILW